MFAAGTAQAREEQEAPQQQAPPDMRTGQSAKACLRREVPTDHEARGQAQRRQLRRVATELRRDHDPEAGAKYAKHIRTQADHQSRMTSVRGKQKDLHAQRLEGTHRGGGDAGDAGQSSRPTSTTTSQSSRALEKRAEENTWVSTWTGKQLVENKGSREATQESHGVPWRAAHGVP